MKREVVLYALSALAALVLAAFASACGSGDATSPLRPGSSPTSTTAAPATARAADVCKVVPDGYNLKLDSGRTTCFAERGCVDNRVPRCEIFVQVFVDRDPTFAQEEVAKRRTQQWRTLAIGDEGVESRAGERDYYEIFFRRGSARVSIRVLPALKADATAIAGKVDAGLQAR